MFLTCGVASICCEVSLRAIALQVVSEPSWPDRHVMVQWLQPRQPQEGSKLLRARWGPPQELGCMIGLLLPDGAVRLWMVAHTCKLDTIWVVYICRLEMAPSDYYNYTPRNEVRGGILDSACLSVRLSVCPSVCPLTFSCPPCSIYSSGWILSIFGTNDQ